MVNSFLIVIIISIIIIIWLLLSTKKNNMEPFIPIYDISNVNLINKPTTIEPAIESFNTTTDIDDQYVEQHNSEELKSKKNSINRILQNKIPGETKDEKMREYNALYTRPIAVGLKRTRRIKVSS